MPRHAYGRLLLLCALLLAGVASAELGVRTATASSSRALIGEPAVLAPVLARLRAVPTRHVRDPRAAAIVSGIVFGRADGITMVDRERFRRAGLWHVLAASGQNVALVAGLCLLAARLTGSGRVVGSVWALVAIPAYVLAVGGGPSIMRAGIMGMLGVLAWLVGRVRGLVDAMLVSAVVLVWVAPGSHRSLGFQLSYASVAAMLVWCGPISARLHRAAVPQALAGAVAATLACGVATTPVLLLRVGEAPGAGIVSNLVGVPIAAVVLAVGLLASAVDMLVPGAGWVPMQAAGALATALAQVAALGARLPVAGVGALPASLAAVVALSAWCAHERGNSHDALRGPLARVVCSRRALVAGLLVPVLVAWAAMAMQPRAGPVPEGSLRVSFFDVGQGDATLVQSGPRAVLVDTGPPGSNVVGALRRAGVRRLDGLVLTHDSLDHIGSVDRVVSALHPAWIAVPATGPSRWGGVLLAGVEPIRLCRGTGITVGHVVARVVHPPCDHAAPVRTGDAHNDNAVVLLVRLGDAAVLLPADAEATVTAQLVEGQVDVLKVAHHGSRDPMLATLLAATRPSIAVVSVGAGNRYGHPTSQVLGVLQAAGVMVLRTDRDGTVVVDSNGSTLDVHS